MNKLEPELSSLDEEPSLGAEWMHAVMQPTMLINGAVEYFMLAFGTRPWRRILYFSPVLLVLAFGIGLIVYGRFLDRDTLVMRYAKLADAEMQELKKVSAPPSDQANRSSVLMQEEQTSSYSDMLFRRLLQLNDKNAKTRYLVAYQLARSQRVVQARRLMEEIAPADGKGYPPAHAWLAIDLLAHQPLDKDQQAKLLRHLDMVKDWEGSGSGLLAYYANILALKGNRTEALDVMGKAARKDPGLQSAYSIMARQFNMPRIAEDVSKKARAELQTAIKQPNATPQQFIQLASLELTEENLDVALDVARTGLNTVAKGNEQLKFLGSEALRHMYRKSIRKTEKGVEFNLNLLDMAMKEYPANQNIATEVLLLEDMGVEASSELKAVMEKQLAEGKATALAHLVLANQKIKVGQLYEAIPHLELTLKSAPGHPVALNNLAMALAMTDATKVDRAQELIATALTVDPRNPELYDSQGHIRLIANKPIDAVQSFERAIGLDPTRINSRESIVKAYRQAGMEALAVAQEKTTAELKAKLAEKPTAERSANKTPFTATEKLTPDASATTNPIAEESKPDAPPDPKTPK